MNDTVVKLFPTSLHGSISAISSKSVAHRAIIAAALSDQPSTLYNVLLSDDIKATLNAVKKLGTSIKIKDSSIYIKPKKKRFLKAKTIDCNESGSTLRFLIPVTSLYDKTITLTGRQSLLNRPMTLYEDVFNKSDSTLTIADNKIVVNGSIKPGEYILKGNVSSQFFTGLMLTLPLLDGDSTLIVEGPLESKSYIDLTIDVLKSFNITIKERENRYYIKGNQQYKGNQYTVEGDFSQAAFFFVAGAINGGISIHNLNINSVQGDKAIIDFLTQMNAQPIVTDNGYTITKKSTLGTTIDISNCPDLAPILSLLGSVSEGTTKLINAHRLKIKESDRIYSTVSTLKALGADITNDDESITIKGKKHLEGGVTVDSFNDHRIAMMVAIATTVCKNPVTLTNAKAVNKSYPSFFEDYKRLGGIIEIKE
ncbi:MAG: 3-phosphoshikimate 1-carboxyvinyltransferase [Candidatus Izemoplasma sp.]|nr:3-phosphoshikimate 1-carboxyvinyltransferase [Candidatus Izemoplasma sp.]